MPYLAHGSCVDYILHFKHIYFAGIAFICDVDAVKLSHICCVKGFNPHKCSGSRWTLGWGVGGGKLSPFQMSILINIFVACQIRIEKGPMTESVAFFSKHDILNVLAVPLVNVYLT